MRLLPPDAPPGCRDEPMAPRPGQKSGARVWLIRHPEVEAEAARYAYGNGDVPLAEAGRARALELARRFEGREIARVTSSPLERALAMGRAIARATRCELVVDEHFAELWRGEWQGMPLDEYAARWRADARAYWEDPLRWKGHGGESEEELRARTWPAFEAATAGAGTFVITTHYQVLRSIVAAALGLAPARSHALQNDPGHATLLVDGPLGWTLERSNVRSPFAPCAGD